MTDDQARFDRIERKIDILVDAVSKMAIVEERLRSTNQRLNKVEITVEKLDEKVDVVSEVAAKNTSVTSFASKVFWIAVGGLASIIGWTIREGQ